MGCSAEDKRKLQHELTLGPAQSREGGDAKEGLIILVENLRGILWPDSGKVSLTVLSLTALRAV